jgi:hypothetical protein
MVRRTEEQFMASSATFRIRRVKCRDEMGGSFREKFGNDEIKCAVFSADLRGSTRNSGRIKIYDDFDDGDEMKFNPPKEVVTLDLAGATGEVELSFSVLLIESQLTEGDGLQKAWDAFVKLYEESLKGELTKRQMTPEKARAIAQPGYLSPRSRHPSAVWHAALGGGALMAAAAGGGAVVAAPGAGPMWVAATADSGTGTEDEKKKEEEKKTVGDAFIVALGTACALYVVKYAGAGISALIGWAKDKLFPPVAIKAKVDASAPPESVPPNATGVVEFRGHDGIYEMEWDIVVR